MAAMRVPVRSEPAILRAPFAPDPDRIIAAMHGLQLTADLRGCAPGRPAMTDPAALRDACRHAVRAAGLTPVGELFHRYAPAPGQPAPAGITGVVLLAESHVAVHTWPELGAATLDVYVCNLGRDNSARAEALLAALIELFAPAAVERHALMRGETARAAA
jgi:S-adenosylmethionine decarboxylase